MNPRWWGIGRWIANEFGTRESVVRMLGGGYYGADTAKLRIHLLGMSDHLDDDVHCCKMQGVIGMDSANPLVAGLDGQVLFKHEYSHVKGDTKTQYWKLEYGDPECLHWKSSGEVQVEPAVVGPGYLMNIKANISNLRRVINGQPPTPYP